MSPSLCRWSLAAVLATLAAPAGLSAQGVCNPISGASDTTSVPIGDDAVEVCYPRRDAGDGPVFGYALAWEDTGWQVSFDSLWATSAVLSVPTAVEAAGVRLEPGTYVMHTVPSEFDWIVIFTSDVAHVRNGAPYAGAAREAEVGRALVRSSVHPERLSRLTLSGAPSGSSSGDLALAWGHRQVNIPVRRVDAFTDIACELRGQPDQLAGRASPPDSVDFTLGDARGRVCYGRPSARDREVLGRLIPVDDMWRVGANEPTVVHLPVRARIAGIPVPAGDYVLDAIASEGDWVIVVGASTNRWGRVTPTETGGRSQYTPEVRVREVGRAMVHSERTDTHVEQFTITADPQSEVLVHLVLEWERTRVRVPILRH